MDIESSSSNEKIDETDEKEEKAEVVDSESSDEGESLFPDTSIQLQHVKGDKYVDHETAYIWNKPFLLWSAYTWRFQPVSIITTVIKCVLFIVIRITKRKWVHHPFCPLFTPSILTKC